jgi:hypothetical protein
VVRCTLEALWGCEVCEEARLNLMHPLSSNSKSWALICRGGSCFDTWSAFARLAAKYAAALRSLERDLKATPPFQHKHKLDGKSEPTDTELLPKARRRRATVKDILPGETLKDFEQRCLLWRARAPASAPTPARSTVSTGNV